MSAHSSGLLKELLALPLAQRLDAVHDDLLKRSDKFREIDPHDLAEALGVPQPESPSGEWSFTRLVEKRSLEDYADTSSASEVFQEIEGIKNKFPNKRLSYLERYYIDAQKSDLGVLTAEERSLLEEAIALRELEEAAEVGMNCFARYSVISPSGGELPFEGDIEDDGACIDLRTPYDFRDDRFIDFENCVTDEW